MTSSGELHELAADEGVKKTHPAGLQPVHQMWRHTVVGISAPLEVQLQDEGATVVGEDFQARNGLAFILPIPPTARQRKSLAWTRPDRAAAMSARQLFELFSWSEFRDATGAPLTQNLDFITLVMLATAKEVEAA